MDASVLDFLVVVGGAAPVVVVAVFLLAFFFPRFGALRVSRCAGLRICAMRDDVRTEVTKKKTSNSLI